jgi:predicted ATPase
MKHIDVEINNFGKIKQAKFQVKPFTVIAGKNASGKSFITRGLYSVFSTLNKDHFSIDLEADIYSVQQVSENMSTDFEPQSQEASKLWTEMRSIVNQLAKNMTLSCQQGMSVSQLASIGVIETDVQQLRKAHNALGVLIVIDKDNKLASRFWDMFQNFIVHLEFVVRHPEIYFNNLLAEQCEQALVENFQINSFSKLQNKETAPENELHFNFGEAVGQLFSKSNELYFESNAQGVDDFQRLDNVIYLESPMYWKIKDALKGWVNSRNDPALRRQVKHQEKALKKVPQYILDTFELLDTDIVQDESYPELIKLKQTIEQCIGGHIKLSDGGNLQFAQQNEQGERYSVDLNQMATGATSLGIIALMLDKNIIVPNSVLIFDEPEVNLHPAWQQVMIQVLYQLSLAGVIIVMASHSFDMMQCIEKLLDVHETDDKDASEHFSIVQLEDGSTINHNKPLYKKLDAVKADLGMPLFDLFSKL